MRRVWIALGAVLLLAPPVRAADHADGPNAKNAPESDITDVYTWMKSDGKSVYLIMNTSPGATSATKFSDKVQFVFHVNSTDKYGETNATKISTTNIICTFDTAQTVSCWLGPASTSGIGTPVDYVTGDASKTAGLTSLNGKFKVFAGPRDDPFFFNFDGFTGVAACVETVAPALLAAGKFDGSGCPQLTADQVTLLGKILKGTPNSMPCGDPTPTANDKFAGKNVLSLVLAVDTATLTGGTNKILGVWGSTHRKP